ncbi:hypothetical protein H633G_11521 [Metarhizium anisopliae BRIP 53284]|nr:hypothetical protein H633G_11521 [Metarhizium anisopliae BRIP 53284]
MGFTAVIGQGVIYGWGIFGAAICGFFSMSASYSVPDVWWSGHQTSSHAKRRGKLQC